MFIAALTDGRNVLSHLKKPESATGIACRHLQKLDLMKPIYLWLWNLCWEEFKLMYYLHNRNMKALSVLRDCFQCVFLTMIQRHCTATETCSDSSHNSTMHPRLHVRLQTQQLIRSRNKYPNSPFPRVWISFRRRRPHLSGGAESWAAWGNPSIQQNHQWHQPWRPSHHCSTRPHLCYCSGPQS